jgi:Protein of unknown function (DUF2752)
VTGAQAAAPLRTSFELDTRGLRLAGGLMLGVAAVLPFLPEGAGLPCPLRTLTGVPCPLCGMTTSVAAAVHLRLEEAVAATPAGVALAAAAVLLFAVRPRRLRIRAPLLYATLVAMWLYQLHRFAFL